MWGQSNLFIIMLTQRLVGVHRIFSAHVGSNFAACELAEIKIYLSRTVDENHFFPFLLFLYVLLLNIWHFIFS